MEFKELNSQNLRIEWWYQGLGGGGNGEILVKRYNPSFTRSSSGHLMYTTVTTEYCTGNTVDLKCSHYTHTNSNRVKWWMC